MATTNFSIAQSDHVQFDWTGWPPEAKDSLRQAVGVLTGVTGFKAAGGNDSFNVSFDGAVIGRDDLIASVAELADQILPGNNWSAR